MTETENPTVFLTLDQWVRIRRFVDQAVGASRWKDIGDAIGRQPPGNVTLQQEQWRFLANNLRTGDDKADIALRHYIMRSVPLSLRPAPEPHTDGFVREDFAGAAETLRNRGTLHVNLAVVLAALDRASGE